jgi:hypothetical protein
MCDEKEAIIYLNDDDETGSLRRMIILLINIKKRGNECHIFYRSIM